MVGGLVGYCVRVDRQPVTSSSLASVGYDAEASVLEVEFTDGRVYRFLDVPEFLFRGLMLAPSKGVFYNRNIEDRYFDWDHAFDYRDRDALVVADIDLEVARAARDTWRFYEHRRPEAYGALAR